MSVFSLPSLTLSEWAIRGTWIKNRRVVRNSASQIWPCGAFLSGGVGIKQPEKTQISILMLESHLYGSKRH
ncbi:hypothetical protein ABMA09_13955 [Erwinia rhapontici]|uniref:hypothetical protein n=1 Tax=Erwinia rhapontici TaxID=55212 RepID=UPI003D363FFD